MSREHPLGALWRDVILGLNSALCGKRTRQYVAEVLGTQFPPGWAGYNECRKILDDLAGGLAHGNPQATMKYVQILQKLLPVIQQVRPDLVPKMQEAIQGLMAKLGMAVTQPAEEVVAVTA